MNGTIQSTTSYFRLSYFISIYLLTVTATFSCLTETYLSKLISNNLIPTTNSPAPPPVVRKSYDLYKGTTVPESRRNAYYIIQILN